ncbi:hypothetical protein HMPREF2531_01529 [Bacteroides intestinalis]|uniref:Uncharacterized protein n=1 Tax=Bacteroides intestinalis TaxID=329854 RepID=A0A139LMV3_9BACE|nr:hypothetical protein HMPREF2531_01529 [Bacteroides intestinalis]
MKQFFDKDFWKNTVGCTVGTLIGILLLLVQVPTWRTGTKPKWHGKP